MTNAFKEDYHSSKAEPLTEQNGYGFDWDRLFEIFGEAEEKLDDRDFAALKDAFITLLDWVINITPETPYATRVIGRRVLALAWVINPGRFDMLSVREFSEQLGLSPTTLSKIGAEVSRKFHISNPFQAHDWRKEEKQNADRIEDGIQEES